VTVKPAPTPDVAELKARAERAKAAISKPPALGTAAPEWKTTDWSDGRPRALADYRGKVVFLDFWGLWCGGCMNGMPSLERLKQKYEPRGVVFVSIHTPGEDIKQIRRFFDLKKVSLVSAVDADAGHPDAPSNGVTADRYGVRGYPAFMMIDRQGNLAFHSGVGTKENVAAMKALGQEMGLKESTMTEADFYRLWEVFFGREIEKVLSRP
jgi:thiol-disulfide isomerase/thioredoxin